MARGPRTHGGEIDVETVNPNALYSPADPAERKRREEIRAIVERRAGLTLQRQALRDAGGDREAARALLAQWVDMLGLNHREVRLNDEHLTKYKGSKYADD